MVSWWWICFLFQIPYSTHESCPFMFQSWKLRSWNQSLLFPLLMKSAILNFLTIFCLKMRIFSLIKNTSWIFFFSKVWPSSVLNLLWVVSFKDAIFLFRNSNLFFSRTFYWWTVGRLSQWNFSDKIYKLTKSLHHLQGSAQWTLDSASEGQAHWS